MIESLKDDTVFTKMGGQFKFTSLVQHRMRELLEGARPLVERRGRTDFEIAVQEVVEGKITLNMSGEVEEAEFVDPFAPTADTATATAEPEPDVAVEEELIEDEEAAEMDSDVDVEDEEDDENDDEDE